MMTQLGPLAIHASPVTVRCGRSLWWCWSVFVGLLLLGCSPGAAPDGDAHEVTSARASSDTLEKELGGPARLLEFFLTRSDDEIRNKLAAYGMRFERHPDTQPAFEEGSTGFGAPGIFSRHLPEGVPGDDRDTCPKFYLDEPQHDNTDVWHEINGEVYYVDWRGRPGAAYSKLPPVSSEPRKPMCQSNVGRWGASEDASQSFDGGHLIGSQLGGWGFRANLVPQNRNFNRGNWLQLENAMTKCASLSAERMVYRIAVNYGQGADRNDKVVPLAFNMKVDDQTGPDDLDLHFANANYGGANGTAERQRGVDYLRGKGCTANPPHAVQPDLPGRIKIMFVGDSITHSSAGMHSWRYRLHEHLRASGVSFDFVGPYDRASNGYYAVGGWDSAHAAASGRAAIDAKELIGEDVEIYHPDVLLVNLGTNDMTWWGGSPESTAEAMEQLIARARESNPGVHIVLAQIGDTVHLTDDESAQYRQRLAELAARTSTVSSRVFLADVYRLWNWATDSDGTHPNARGEYVIAKAFADSLSQNLHIGLPFGPIPVAAGPPQPTGVVLSPNAITPTTRFAISWNRVVNPGIWTTYKVQIRNHKNYGFALVWESVETDATSMGYYGPPLGFGTYHVVVLSRDGTSETMSGEVPLVVSPSVGPPKPAPPVARPGIVKPGMPFFITWDRVVNPGIWTTYKVQVRQHKAFGFGLIWESPATPDTGILYNGPTLGLGTHHVVVVAVDGAHENPSEPSLLEVRSYVGPPKPDNVALTPDTVPSGGPFFATWSRVVNPGVWTTYKVQVRNHVGFGFGLVWESAETSDAGILYQGPRLNPGIYHVVVVARDGTYEAMSDIAALTVTEPAPAPQIFPTYCPDGSAGQQISYMVLPASPYTQAHAASRYKWHCDFVDQDWTYDVFVSAKNVTATSMHLNSFTFVNKGPRFDLLELAVVSGSTNHLPDGHFLDSVPRGGSFQVEVDADTALPAYILMRAGYYGINEACAGVGLIQLRSYWVDPNAPLCRHGPS